MLSPNNEKKKNGPKRFYKFADMQEKDGVYAIVIDGKPLQTPLRKSLETSSKEIAALIVEEWNAQKEYIDPAEMPMTLILNTRLDKIETERESITAEILKFFDTDMVCYYAEEPQELLAREKAAWNTAHLWFAEKSGESLKTTQAITALKQSETAHEFIQKFVSGLDDDRFTLLQILTPLTGSLMLACAFCDGALKEQDILKACFVEEDYKADLYNEERHGGDPYINKKKDALARDTKAAELYLKAL